MTIQAALQWGRRELQEAGLPRFASEAESLLSSIQRQPPAHFFTYPEEILTAAHWRTYQRWIGRRKKYYPLAYLTRHAEFCQLPLFVDERVLIPRVETEELVELVVRAIGRASQAHIADIGTGSGAIAIALAHALPQVTCVATDVSKRALAVARRNVQQLNCANRVQLRRGDLLHPLTGETIDVLVSNPPYLSRREYQPISQAQRVELSAEPSLALLAGSEGLGVYQRLFQQLHRRTQKPPLVCLEFGWGQTTALRRLIKARLPEYHCEIKRDQFGRPRFVLLKLAAKKTSSA